MNYRETLDLLYGMLPDFQNIGGDAYKPGLERMERFNRHLGNPDGRFLSIHVAGTNGKGSVSHILASILQSAGYRTGLFTSPHLHDFRERIKVDGEMIPEERVVGFAEAHSDMMHSFGMSFFEASTAMALDYFASQEVEVAVMEAGLGGRLDSTNILKPVLSIITNIGLEHQAYLGETLEKIAAEKAGIIKRGVPVVVGETDKATAPVFMRKAAAESAPVTFADRMFSCVGAAKENGMQDFLIERAESGEKFGIRLDLMGDYQCRNMVTVLAAVGVLNEHTSIRIDDRALRSGAESAAVSTGLRGRWEIAGHKPLVVLDTGHNAHGLRLVADQIRNQNYDKLYMVFGVVRDKDLSEILPLLPAEAHYIFTQPSVTRALPASELAVKAAEYGLRGETATTVTSALERARELASPRDMIFVGGSTFTVADAIE